MSVFDDVLDAVIDLAEETSPYASINIGALPMDNGICITWATGAPETTFWDKNAVYQITAVLNGKHSNQRSVSNALGAIHAALTRNKSYPATNQYQITNIETVSTPSYIGREDNGQWLYGSSIRVKFYYRG